MATVFTESFESGSNGTAITTSNTSYSSVNGTGTTVFDNSYFVAGSLSAKMTPTGTNTINLREIFSGGSVSGRYFRRYFRVNSLPLSTTILTLMRIRLSGTLGQVVLNPAGTIQIRDNNTAVATSSSKITLNTWFRIEWHVDGTGATQTCQIFLSSNYSGATPDETLSGSYSGGNFDRIEDGIGTGSYPGTLWLDEAGDDDATWPGPVAGANQPPTASAGTNQTVVSQQVVTLDGTGSTDVDGTIASYSWAQLTGTAVALSDPTVVQPTFTAPTVTGLPITLSFGLVVTDNLGAQSTQSSVTITVDPPAASAFSEDFGGTTVNGDAITTSNTAYASLNGTPTFDNAALVSGSYSANFTTAGGVVDLTQNLPSPTSARYLRRYFRLSAMPTSSVTIIHVRLSGSGATAQVVVTATGLIQMRNANTTVATSTNIITPNTWFRLEWEIDGTTTNTQTLKLFLLGNYNGSSATETLSGAYTSGTFDRIDDGPSTSSAFTGTMWLDGVSDQTSSFPGPLVSANLPPAADAGPDQSVADNVTVTLDGTGSTDSDGFVGGFLWSQTSGTHVPLSSNTVAQPTFTSPSTGTTIVFSLIAIDDKGAGSDPDTVTITDTAPIAAFNESFENGSNGATITTSNVTYDTITGTSTFDNSTTAAGLLSGKMVGTGTSATTLRQTLAVSVTARYFRRYFRVSAVPSGANLVTLVRIRLAGTNLGQVVMIAGGLLQIRNANTVVATSVNSASAGAWFRVEWFVDGTTTNTQTLRIYMGSLLNSATTPTETISGAYTGGSFNRIEDGIGTVGYVGTLWLDEAQDQTSTWPGPAAGLNQPPTVNAGPDQTVLPGDTVTLDGTGSMDPDGTIASYSWSQITGTTVSLSSQSAAQPTFAAPILANGDSLVFSLVVTDNSGATSQVDSVTITVQVANEFVLKSGSWQVGPPSQM